MAKILYGVQGTTGNGHITQGGRAMAAEMHAAGMRCGFCVFRTTRQKGIFDMAVLFGNYQRTFSGRLSFVARNWAIRSVCMPVGMQFLAALFLSYVRSSDARGYDLVIHGF